MVMKTQMITMTEVEKMAKGGTTKYKGTLDLIVSYLEGVLAVRDLASFVGRENCNLRVC